MPGKYKLIALDLDGTLLNSRKEITPANCLALKEALAGGIHVVIASGRPFQALPEEIRSFRGIEYAITSNGSSIFQMRESRRIFCRDLSKDCVHALMPLIRSADFPCEAAIAGTCYAASDYFMDPPAFGLPDRMREYVQRTRLPVKDMPGFIEMHAGELEGIFFLIPDPVKMEEIRECVSRVKGLYMTSSTPYYLEIADQDVSKAQALDWLCQRLDVGREQIIAFGDSSNDQELLEYAGTGVAMGNAAEALKKNADAVTLSNEEDGVAFFLREQISGSFHRQSI